MDNKMKMIGKWVSSLPDDSDDLLVEYEISSTGDVWYVNAKDLQDGEVLEISDITFSGNKLKFVSYVPSTGRKGLNEFSLIENDLMESKFTFTVIEKLQRKL